MTDPTTPDLPQTMISRPWFAQKTILASIGGTVAAGAALIAAMFYSESPAKSAAVVAFGGTISALLGNLGSVFAAQRASAAGRVAVAADAKASTALGVQTEAQRADPIEPINDPRNSLEPQ